MSDIERGAKVVVRDAMGRDLLKRALTKPVRGCDFVVVWVCSENDWVDDLPDPREHDGSLVDRIGDPWPYEDVRLPGPHDHWPDLHRTPR